MASTKENASLNDDEIKVVATYEYKIFQDVEVQDTSEGTVNVCRSMIMEGRLIQRSKVIFGLVQICFRRTGD